ncbi:MAG: hypothetical protein IPJ65_32195 [Archangiaceae bacterium]|nr:hypothetical protein [Archangiaceae bacterium]
MTATSAPRFSFGTGRNSTGEHYAGGGMKQPFPVPYGLFIALGVYALLVLGYVYATYWNSAEYQAAEHFVAAGELLGLDDGRKASKETLTEAYGHYLEAARLLPRVKLLHDRTEAMRWRFEERKFKLDHDLAMRAEAVATLWTRIQKEEEPLLVVGLRDRGWQPAAMLDGPRRTFLFSLPGALVILVVWGWLRFSGRKARAGEHEARLKSMEAEVAELGGSGRRALLLPGGGSRSASVSGFRFPVSGLRGRFPCRRARARARARA